MFAEKWFRKSARPRSALKEIHNMIIYFMQATTATTTCWYIRQCKVIFMLLPHISVLFLLQSDCGWLAGIVDVLLFSGILFYFNRFELLFENVKEWLIFHYRNTIHDKFVLFHTYKASPLLPLLRRSHPWQTRSVLSFSSLEIVFQFNMNETKLCHACVPCIGVRNKTFAPNHLSTTFFLCVLHFISISLLYFDNTTKFFHIQFSYRIHRHTHTCTHYNTLFYLFSLLRSKSYIYFCVAGPTLAVHNNRINEEKATCFSLFACFSHCLTRLVSLEWMKRTKEVVCVDILLKI